MRCEIKTRKYEDRTRRHVAARSGTDAPGGRLDFPKRWNCRTAQHGGTQPATGSTRRIKTGCIDNERPRFRQGRARPLQGAPKWAYRQVWEKNGLCKCLPYTPAMPQQEHSSDHLKHSQKQATTHSPALSAMPISLRSESQALPLVLPGGWRSSDAAR